MHINLKMYIQELESKIIEMDGYNSCLNISGKKKQ